MFSRVRLFSCQRSKKDRGLDVPHPFLLPTSSPNTLPRFPRLFICTLVVLSTNREKNHVWWDQTLQGKPDLSWANRPRSNSRGTLPKLIGPRIHPIWEWQMVFVRTVKKKKISTQPPDFLSCWAKCPPDFYYFMCLLGHLLSFITSPSLPSPPPPPPERLWH